MNPDGVWQAIDAQRAGLCDLLADLGDDEWRQPSLCAGWTVRDVAAHLTLQQLGPGAFLTHAAGVVHGPHESRGGAKVLTVQSWRSRDGRFDSHLADKVQEERPPPGGTATAVIPDPTAPNLDNRDAEQATG